MKLVNGKIVNDKLLETSVFTIAALSRTTRNAKVRKRSINLYIELSYSRNIFGIKNSFDIFFIFQVTASLLKWLIESLSKCNSPECLQLYVNALKNTHNEKLAPLLFNLVEDNCRTGIPK